MRYDLYFLRNGGVCAETTIEARDDDEAALIASEQGRGDTVEVWNAYQRVRVIPTRATAPPQAAPLDGNRPFMFRGAT